MRELRRMWAERDRAREAVSGGRAEEGRDGDMGSQMGGGEGQAETEKGREAGRQVREDEVYCKSRRRLVAPSSGRTSFRTVHMMG